MGAPNEASTKPWNSELYFLVFTQNVQKALNRYTIKILEARGSFDKHPERRRNEPEPTGPIGDPPEYFNDGQRETWEEIVSMAPPRVFTNMDRIHVEIMARLLYDFRNGGLSAGDRRQLDTCPAKMGFYPRDRANVTVQPPAKKNPYEKIGRARQAQA